MMELERVLEMAKGVSEEAEVFWVHSSSTPVGFEANRLKHLETRENSGLALRLIKNGRIGFSATTNLQDLEGLVARAAEIAQWGPGAQFHLPGPQTYPSVDVFAEEVPSASLDSMVQLGQVMIDKVRQRQPDLLCDAHVAKSVSQVELLNSNGGRASYRKTGFRVGLDGTLVRGTDMLFVGDYLSSCRVITDTQSIVQTVLEQLEQAREIVPPPIGKVPVVFTYRGVMGALWGPLMTGFNGKTVLQKASPLVGKIGEKLFDEHLSIWDDPTIPYVPGSRLCDDEGVPSQRTPLVQNGVVMNFLYDLQTAALAGTKSTASANRGLGTLPSPGPGTVVIQEGETPLEQLIADVSEGLLVEMLLGAGQGNVLNGDFSGNVLLGYRIKAGKVVGRVKDTTVSGNVYEALSQGVAFSKETRWLGGMLKTPAIRCQGISVSGKE